MRIDQDTFQLLEPIVAAMPKVMTVKSVVDNTGGLYTLNTCDTLWLTIGYSITINSVDYVVKDLITNQWVQVLGPSLPVKGDVTIRAPFFDHGTFILKNADVKRKNSDSWNYLPMIFLHEPTINKQFPQDDDGAIERISTCDFYFLIDCDFKQWLTADHYRYAVRPMRNLMRLFIEFLKNHGSIGIFEDFEDYDCPNWGINIDNKGTVKRLIDEELSGCGCKIDLPLLTSLICDC